MPIDAQVAHSRVGRPPPAPLQVILMLPARTARTAPPAPPGDRGRSASEVRGGRDDVGRSSPSGGSAREIGDDVPALAGVGNRQVHPRSWSQALWPLQPDIQAIGGPGPSDAPKRRRIVVARNRSHGAAHHAPMTWSRAIGIERMATAATALVKGAPARRVARTPGGGLRGEDRQDRHACRQGAKSEARAPVGHRVSRTGRPGPESPFPLHCSGSPSARPRRPKAA